MDDITKPRLLQCSSTAIKMHVLYTQYLSLPLQINMAIGLVVLEMYGSLQWLAIGLVVSEM